MSTELIFEEATFATPTYAHGAVITNLGAALHAFDPDHRAGHSFGPQTTYPMVGEPPVREPDLTWVRANRLPADLNVDPDRAPDLAVEIISRSDTHANTDARVRQYLASGVSMVWIIDPWAAHGDGLSPARAQHGLRRAGYAVRRSRHPGIRHPRCCPLYVIKDIYTWPSLSPARAACARRPPCARSSPRQACARPT